MTDYYTKASFVIPCSKEQAKTAIKALQHIDGDLTDFAIEMISKSNDDIFEPEDKIIRLCSKNHPDSVDQSGFLSWDFSSVPCKGGILVCHNESINTEHAAIFTQAVLSAFNLPHLVKILAAHTCSKPREDAFGGHACVVTKDYIHWNRAEDFLAAERKAHNKLEHYYACGITDPSSKNGIISHFLIKCTGQDDPKRHIKNIFQNYPDDGLALKKTSVRRITPYEFKVMQAHLTVLK